MGVGGRGGGGQGRRRREGVNNNKKGTVEVYNPASYSLCQTMSCVCKSAILWSELGISAMNEYYRVIAYHLHACVFFFFFFFFLSFFFSAGGEEGR